MKERKNAMSIQQFFADSFRRVEPSIRGAELIRSDAVQNFMSVDATGKRRFDDSFMTNCWQTTAGGVLRFKLDLLLKETSLTVGASFEDEMMTPFHKNDSVELIYVAEGRLRQRILGQFQEFTQGEIVIIDRECEHADCILAEDASIVYLSMNASFFEESMLPKSTDYKIHQFMKEIIFARREKYKFVVFHPGNKESGIPDLIERTLREMDAKKPGHIYLVKGYMERILYLLLTEYTVDLVRQEKKKQRESIFSDMTAYINQHYRDVCIADLVSIFHYNEDYFNRLIKSQTGMTFKKYHQKVRLEKAEYLLKTTSIPVEQIAANVGYANTGFFYKIFEEKYGITPAAIRQERES